MMSKLNGQTTTEVLIAVASIAASAVLVRTIYRFRNRLQQSCHQHKIVIDAYQEDDYINQEFQAVDIFLGPLVASSARRFRVSKDYDLKKPLTTLDINEEIVDVFEDVHLKWRMSFKDVSDTSRIYQYMRSYELIFDKKHEEKVLNSYLPYILERSKAIKEEIKTIKLYPVDYETGVSEYHFEFDHPVTFTNLAIDSELKAAVMDDLNKFLNAKEYYKSIGKAWKRGYLLYGPPGTGKSSLIAAMANHLNYDIYDFDLSGYDENPEELTSMAPYISSQSIIVFEDLVTYQENLWTILDEFWNLCGDERIIVFTMNGREGINSVWLRYGLIDMQMHMSYCTGSAFKQLAFNHFRIRHHKLFDEIERLMKEVEVITIAGVAGELMKSTDAEVSLQGLLKSLRMLWTQVHHSHSLGGPGPTRRRGRGMRHKTSM